MILFITYVENNLININPPEAPKKKALAGNSQNNQTSVYDNMKKEDLIFKLKEFEEKLKLEKEDKKKQIELKNKELEAKDKIIFSIGGTNKKLLAELEDLKKEVDDKLDKIGMRQLVEKEREIEKKKREVPYEQVLKVKEKELKNTMNLLEILKKDKENLQKNFEEKTDVKRIRALEDKLKEEEFRNNQLEIEIKLNKNLKDEHNKCEQMRENFEKERKTIFNEIKFVKDMNKQLIQKVKEEEERQIKKQNYIANSNSQQKSENNLINNNNNNSTKNNNSDNNNNNNEENSNESNNNNSSSKRNSRNINLPNINKFSNKLNSNKSLARSKELNLDKYWKQLDNADKAPQNKTDPEKNASLAASPNTAKKSINKLESKKKNLADRQKFSVSLSHKTFKLDNEENAVKLFGIEEKEILLKILPSNEVEKLEKKFEFVQKSKITLEKKFHLETKQLSKKVTELDERLEYTNLHNKELEQRNKILGYQINEHKSENRIFSKKLHELNGNVNSSKSALKQKEEENKMLVLKVQEMQKSLNELSSGQEKSGVGYNNINSNKNNEEIGRERRNNSDTDENREFNAEGDNNEENEHIENEDGEENEFADDAGNEDDN